MSILPGSKTLFLEFPYKSQPKKLHIGHLLDLGTIRDKKKAEAQGAPLDLERF